MRQLASPHTERNYRGDVAAWTGTVGPLTGRENGAHLQRFLRAQKTAGLSPVTVRLRANRLVQLMCWLEERGFIRKASPSFREVALPRSIELREPKALSAEATARLMKVLRERRCSDRDAAMVALMFFAGLRVGEIVALRRKDCSRDGATLTLTVRGKAGTVARVELLPQAARALGRHLRGVARDNLPVAPLFHGERSKEPLTTRAVQLRIRAIFDDAGIPKAFGCHALRHTYASLLCAGGVPLPEIQRRLRHTNMQTTLRYLWRVPPQVGSVDRMVRRALPAAFIC